MRGWERMATLLAPPGAPGAFLVLNPTGYFAGDLSSWIDRRMYVFGGYEQDSIRAFLSMLPADRRGIVLDVGANVGPIAWPLPGCSGKCTRSSRIPGFGRVSSGTWVSIG